MPTKTDDGRERETVAVIGTGTIALGWIALFAARGHRVIVSSTRADARQHVTSSLELYARSMPGGAISPERLVGHLVFAPDVESAVAEADVVQENALERLPLKQELFRRIAGAAPPHALLLSSTSTLLPEDLGRRLADPARVLVGHPFNPPHIVALVEVVAAAGADPGRVAAAAAFYRRAGKSPVVLRRALPGFVANRLQSALLRESMHLVREGVVTVDELDDVVTASIGPRWAVAGPFRAFHLGGGPGGLRHLIEHLGDNLERGWAGLGAPVVDDELKELIVSQADASFGAVPYEELAARRDAEQNAVIETIARLRSGY